MTTCPFLSYKAAVEENTIDLTVPDDPEADNEEDMLLEEAIFGARRPINDKVNVGKVHVAVPVEETDLSEQLDMKKTFWSLLGSMTTCGKLCTLCYFKPITTNQN